MSNTKSRRYDYDYDHNVHARHDTMRQNGRATLLNVARLYFPLCAGRSWRGYLYLAYEIASPLAKRYGWLVKTLLPECESGFLERLARTSKMPSCRREVRLFLVLWNIVTRRDSLSCMISRNFQSLCPKTGNRKDPLPNYSSTFTRGERKKIWSTMQLDVIRIF